MTRPSLTILALLLLTSGCDEPAADPAAEPRPPTVPAQGQDPTTVSGDAVFEAEGPLNPLELPDDLHSALRREMVALEPAMSQLSAQLVRGRGDEAAKTAKQIYDSFILKQELTDAQMETLVSRLPPEFLHRDAAFHRTSLELAHAAERGDLAEATQLYGQLVDACVGCHAAHAATRFPGLEGVSAPPPPAPPEGEEPPGHGHAH